LCLRTAPRLEHSANCMRTLRPCSDRESARPLSLILPSNHPNQIDKKESTTLPSTSTSGSKHREASTEPWPVAGKTRSRSFACSASTTKTIARPKRSHPTPETTHPHTAREAFPAAATRPSTTRGAAPPRGPRPIAPRAFLLSFALPFSARADASAARAPAALPACRWRRRVRAAATTIGRATAFSRSRRLVAKEFDAWICRRRATCANVSQEVRRVSSQPWRARSGS
jgi:hypothetical protein